MEIERTNEVIIEEKSFKSIVEQIFTICKNDSSFPYKNELIGIDERIKELKQKIKKQNILLNKASEIKQIVVKKNNFLDDNIENLRTSILEKLGSEL